MSTSSATRMPRTATEPLDHQPWPPRTTVVRLELRPGHARNHQSDHLAGRTDHMAKLLIGKYEATIYADGFTGAIDAGYDGVGCRKRIKIKGQTRTIVKDQLKEGDCNFNCGRGQRATRWPARDAVPRRDMCTATASGRSGTCPRTGGRWWCGSGSGGFGVPCLAVRCRRSGSRSRECWTAISGAPLVWLARPGRRSAG